MITPEDVAKQLGTRPLKPIKRYGRHYFDAWTTPFGPYVSTPSCEHCDGERSRYVRVDMLRGHVCPPCDSALDAMFREPEDGC